MIVFKETEILNQHIIALKKSGMSVGFVPTMGALHHGHLSLVKLSKSQTDITVASIFINPTQFNDPRDFEKYPVTIEADIALLESLECDILFLPTIAAIYPNGIIAERHYALGPIETLLEGKFRPGHFQGVAQVVHRLLDIVQPSVLFLGSKDYQQCMVIKKLVEIIGTPVKVITAETYRETSGLAMSSRNFRLNDDQLEQASNIYKTFLYIKEHFKTVDTRQLENIATDMLYQSGFTKVDYVSIADSITLQPAQGNETENVVALVAAFVGDVRLIDNMVLS